MTKRTLDILADAFRVGLSVISLIKTWKRHEENDEEEEDDDG